MLNYGMSVDATNTALNSYGSAMREQEKYNESLEARINNMQTAWYGLADSLGNTVLYDTLVVGTEALTKLTNVADGGASSVGLLAVSMGALLAPLSLLSSRFQAFTGDLIRNAANQTITANATGMTTRQLVAQRIASIQTSVATKGLSGSLLSLAASSTAAGAAIRGALMMTGVGIAIAGVTALITIFTNKMSENIQKQEEFDNYLNKNKEALTTNGEQVNKLIAEYDQMSKANKDAWNPETQQKYVDVQNQLAELFPSIVDYVDANGNAHLKTKQAIDAEISATNVLIDAERKLQREQAKKTFDSGLSEISKLESQRKTLSKTRDSKINNLSTEEVAKLNLEILKIDRQISDKSEKIKASVLTVVDAFTEAGTHIEGTVKDHINKAISNIDYSKLNGKELEEFSKTLADVRSKMSEAFKAGDTEAVNKYHNELVKLVDGTGALRPETEILKVSFDSLSKAMEQNAKTAGMASNGMDDVEGSTSALDERISELQENMNDLGTAQEKLSGVSNKTIEDSEELLFMYRQLNNQLAGYTDQEIQNIMQKKVLSSEEQRIIGLNQQRADTIQLLNVLYPQYAKLQDNQISLTYEQIDAMKKEELASKTLNEAYDLAMEGKLSAEQEMTLAQATETKNRIGEIQKEILALNVLIKQYEDTANAKLKAQEFVDKVNSGELQSHSGSFVLPNTTQQLKNEAKQLEIDLSSYQSSMNGYTGSLQKIIDSVGSSEKASKKSNETTKNSIYVTDKFKNALEALNLELVKQEKLRAKEPEWSEKYRKSLQEQIKLEKQKLELQKQQAAELQKQISSGKIKQTGLITTSSGSSKSTSGSTTADLQGWGGRITSGYGMRIHPTLGYSKMHNGIDIAGAKGTGLSANVSGKVTAQGYNSVSGNFVKIQDSNGFQHFYGHLDKAFVKLGDLIEAGTKIGNIGSTGRSTGSHLHYEVKNSSGKYINPADFVSSAKSGKVSVSSSTNGTSNSSTAAEVAQALDNAKSELIGMQQGIADQIEVLEELENKVLSSYFAKFDRRRDEIDRQLSYEDAKISNLNNTSERYAKTQQYQLSLMEKKQQANKEELSYLNDLIKKGGLSAVTMANIKDRAKELTTAMESLNNEIGQFRLDTILAKYELIAKAQDFSIEKLNASMELLDKNSLKYSASLDKIVVAQKNKYNANQQEINDLKKLINSGKAQGEVLEQATDRVHELTVEMQKLQVEMSNANYEIIVNIKTRYDEEIDDISDRLEVSKTIQGLYQEGSADATNQLKKQVEMYQKMANIHDEVRKKLQAELNSRDLLPEQIKQITELLEDETKAYWSNISAMEAANKQIKETDKRLREELANNLINAYKKYVEERRDEHMKMLDDEMDREDKRHAERVKQLNDEMDLFRKNVEERLRLIDRQEAERDYNMEIDEMESERNKLVDSINLLSLDKSHEAKSKRKKLLEQLDKLDKDIAERRHDRDIELQKQGLNDLLEMKEDELSEKEEILNEENKQVKDSLEAQRKYWEKYYTDLLNDERKFASIREDIMNGHFDKVANEFQGYIQEMINTMPLLSDTMNGTMESVGTAIRQNVIDELNNAIQKMKEFQDLQIATDKYVDTFDPNASKDNSYSGNTGAKPPTNNSGSSNNSSNNSNKYSNLNNGDLKVLLGKFIRENIAPQAPEGNERESVKYKGDAVAAEGRAEGSQISPNESLSQALAKLDKGAMTALSNYTTYSFGGITSDKYKQMILKWSNQLRSKAASLDTGGGLRFKGGSGGVDGKGGKWMIAHDNEVVSNPIEVDKMVKSTSLLDGIARMMSPVISKIPALNNIIENANESPTIINFTGEIHNSNGRVAEHLANDIANAMKSKKGKW